MIPFENIPLAPGQVYPFPSGKVLTFKSSTLPVQIDFSGGGARAIAKSGKVFSVPFGGGTITNLNTVAVTVTFVVGDRQASYAADDNSVGNVSHYAYGNTGIADGAAANGGFGLPAAGGLGNAYLQITNAMLYQIVGLNNGHKRQSITFDVAAASAAPLVVKDTQNNTCQVIPAGQARLIVTDSTLRISGLGGVASVAITEVYQANQ